MSTTRPRPQDIAPLDAAEFGIAFQIALDSGQNSANAPSTTPWERARSALKRHFAGRENSFESADFRFRALMDLYTRDTLADWIRSSGDTTERTEIHPAVLDVASRMRLASNGKLSVRKFLEEVAATARRDYADLEEWPLDGFS